MKIDSRTAAAWRAAALAVLLTVTTAACGGKDADDSTIGSAPPAGAGTVAAGNVSVTDVRLGKSVDANNRVAEDTDDFKTSDMIYASVLTTGSAPNATLHARWTFEDGQLVDSTSRSIAPSGDAATSFHIMKPDGFPAGKYKLTVLLNGSEVRTKEFDVER